MSLTLCILLIVALQRLAELWYSNRNTKKLLAEGGKEVGQSHYPINDDFLLADQSPIAALLKLF